MRILSAIELATLSLTKQGIPIEDARILIRDGLTRASDDRIRQDLASRFEGYTVEELAAGIRSLGVTSHHRPGDAGISSPHVPTFPPSPVPSSQVSCPTVLGVYNSVLPYPPGVHRIIVSSFFSPELPKHEGRPTPIITKLGPVEVVLDDTMKEGLCLLQTGKIEVLIKGLPIPEQVEYLIQYSGPPGMQGSVTPSTTSHHPETELTPPAEMTREEEVLDSVPLSESPDCIQPNSISTDDSLMQHIAEAKRDIGVATGIPSPAPSVLFGQEVSCETATVVAAEEGIATPSYRYQARKGPGGKEMFFDLKENRWVKKDERVGINLEEQL